MKTQEQIQMEIDRLNKSNFRFNEKLKVTKGIGNREIIRHEVRKNENKRFERRTDKAVSQT